MPQVHRVGQTAITGGGRQLAYLYCPGHTAARYIPGALRRPEWIPLSFQELYDELLEPCLQHPALSSLGQELLRDYIKTLKHLDKNAKQSDGRIEKRVRKKRIEHGQPGRELPNRSLGCRLMER